MTASAAVRFMPRPLEDVDELASGHDAPAPRAGFVLLPRAVLHASALSRDARLLYAVLLSYAWQEGSCFPSHQRLQADLGCGINQVTRYLRELEDAGLVTRRRRGLGQTTVYTLHDAPPVDAQPAQTHRFGESGVTETVSLESPFRRHKQDSGDYQAREQHHQKAPASSNGDEPIGAVDDALLAALLEHGVTERIAVRLVTTHDAQAIREQLEWHQHRPAAKNPAGSLVRAIQEAWPAPPTWLEAQEHEAAVTKQAEGNAARQAEDEARRREQEARPPEERIAGRLQFWLLGQQRKRHDPTPAEIAAKRAELLAQIVTEAPSLVGHAPVTDGRRSSLVGH